MDVVSRFGELVERPSSEVDLARAALTFALGADPDVDVDRWLGHLDDLADGVDGFRGLRRRLFSELGFTGDAEDYYGEENSLLHRVLGRRRGIPISLSVVMMEVGRRAGVEVQGLGRPGHFLVRSADTGAICDPFNGGALVHGLELGGPLPIADAHAILVRMLANLTQVYAAEQRLPDLEWVLRCQRTIPGAQVAAALQLGEAIAGQGRFLDAAAELEGTAAVCAPSDAATLVAAARAARARLN